MTRKYSVGNRFLSVLLTIAMLISMLPMGILPAFAAGAGSDRVADPSTMDGWKKFFPTTGEISTENAGGVWMDKSVFTDASAFAELGIRQNDPDSFLVALTAIAANMSITGMSHVPTDTMLVLDVSGSMNDNNNNVAKDLVDAANESIRTLLSANKYNRVGVVLYSGPATQGGEATANDAVLILPLGRYETGTNGEYLSYSKNGDNETVSLNRSVVYEGTGSAPFNNRPSKNVLGGTYIQKGIILAMDQFVASGNSVTIEDPALGAMSRKPVLVLMSDGSPTVGSTNFTEPDTIRLGDGTQTSAALGFVSQLSVAYAKAQIEEKYGTDALVYTLGLGIGSDSIALSVLDPDNPNGSVAVDDFWNEIRRNWRGQITFKGYNHVEVGETVSLGNNRSVTKIATPLEQNYVDQYFPANTTNLMQVFESIVNAIQLQSAYFPTLISESEELSGYISFVDKIGQYMSVTDMKGILIGEQLFSGADMASNFVPGGGALGTFENPTALGMEMVAAVRTRLGIASDEEARTLIGLAYEYGQLSYTNADNYSNYIGWYANAAGQFLGFYNEGTTVLPAANGNEATDPAFIIRSYGYLGQVDESHGVTKSDMMYATVQIRKEIATGEELVTFAVPAALIPVVSYSVTLDENGALSNLTVSGADQPIRLVYEVALDSHIDSFHLMETVSAEYLAENTNADGSVNFYTNQWDHENTTGYGTVNTYSYFNPSRQNDKYYYLEDAPVYTDANGTLYTGQAQPSDSDTMYRAYPVYKNNGSLRVETVYRELSDAAKATAVRRDDGTWYIPKGNVHVNLDGYVIDKTENVTGSLGQSNIPFVDTTNHSINEEGYEFYVGATLGNNGRITVTPETGIRLSKTMAQGVAAPAEAFLFTIENITDPADSTTYPARLIRANGTQADTTVKLEAGKASVSLHPGDVIYIGGMTAGQIFRITENETTEYVASATGLSGNGTVTIRQNEIHPVSFVNDNRGVGNLTIAKEVEHDFGQAYQIPADKTFTMQVTLSGIGTANATFTAELTDGAYTEITTNEQGQFTVALKHDERLEVFGLPVGTQVAVAEQDPPAGFVPAYWDNGQPGDGMVTVVDESTVSVIVVNEYQAAQVYPVNIVVSGNKTLSGRPWEQDDSFSFKLEKLLPDGSWQQLGDTVQATYGDSSFRFVDAFQNERYTQSGIYYYRVVEIEPAAPIGGVTYDKTVHAFSVVVSDADMDGQLEISEVRTDRPNTTEITETAAGWDVFASFTNTYSTTGAATVTIDVNKHIQNQGGAEKSLAGYTFGLFDSVTGEQVGDLLTTTDRGFARFVLTYNAAEVGNGDHTFTYILREIAPDPVPTGWSYSTEQIPVTVQVMDDGDGTISAVIYSGSQRPENPGTSISADFTNTYDPADTELAVDFVNKEISGRELLEGEFSFEIRSQDETLIIEGTNDAYGNVIFDSPLTFDKVGTYYYNVRETSTDGNGVVTDKTTYRIAVTVSDADGRLSASYVLVNVIGDTIVFQNNYTTTSVDHAITGVKTLEGRTLINDEFVFLLAEQSVDGVAVENPRTWTARNFGDGAIVFSAITYDRAGTYVYTVEEVIPEGGRAYGITYDQTKYQVTIVVKDTGEGTLEIGSETVSLLNGTSAEAISFRNYYQADPAWAQFTGEKQLTGRVNNALLGGEFAFELYHANENWERGAWKETVFNGAGGIITFTKIDFTSDEDQYFIVEEKNGGQTIDGVTYDDTVYYVWVQVTDDLKGQLHATVHIYDGDGVPQDRISFINVYEVTDGASVTLSGEKFLDGREFKEEDSFYFELYEADENYNTAELPKLTAAMDPNTHKYQITMDYTAQDVGKTFYYLLKEQNGGQTINDIVYSDAAYRIKVVVEDDGTGGIKTIVTVQNATTTTLNFVNEYEIVTGTSVELAGTKELENQTLEDQIFTFDLIASDAEWTAGDVLQSKQNVGAAIRFETIMYTEAGDYYYLVKERNGGQTVDGILYDDAVYRIHVRVSDNLDGTLSRQVSMVKVKGQTVEETNSIVFTNAFVPGPKDITVDIRIHKTVVNMGTDTITAEGFEFLLKALNDEAEGITVLSDAEGDARFTLIFTEDDIGKTYRYTLTEVDRGRDHVTYSTAEYAITIAIKLDQQTNMLTADLTLNEVETAELVAEFENIYKYTPSLPPTGDNAGLGMWAVLMLISGGAATTLYVFDKKRKQTRV